MGYTHYFRQTRKLTDVEWATLSDTVKALVNKVSNEVPVRFECDTTEGPLFDADMIRFNGVDNDGHETFILTRDKREKRDYENQKEYDNDGAFEFCKTANKPYDLLVVASLLAAQYHTTDAWSVSSDGEPNDWEDGLVLAVEVMGIENEGKLRSLIPTRE